MTSPNAGQTFYPSCVVHITLRFEEKMWIRTPAPLLDNATEPPHFTQEPLVTRAGAANETFVMNIVPKKCVVELHGHRQAATYNLTLDFKQLPVDPRTVRAASCEIHMGTVSPTDFGDGVSERRRHEQNPVSILNTRTAQGRIRESTLMLIGPVDEWKQEHGDSSEVTLHGRDLRGLLLDSPLVSPNDHPARTENSRRIPASNILSRLRPSATIDVLVRQIIGEHVRLRDVRVECYAEEWPQGRIPSPNTPTALPRNRRGARGTQAATGSTHSDLNFWDLIVRYCFLVGAIPYFQGRTLYIRPALSLYGAVTTPDTIQSATQGRQLRSDIKQVVYGRHIKKLSVGRKYAGNNKPKTIRCISTNLSLGPNNRNQYIEASWPPRNPRDEREIGAKITHVHSGSNHGNEEILNVPVPGVHSHERLLEIAQSLYEEIGRNEISGTVESGVLATYGRNIPDLLELRPGDPVELLVDVATLNQHENLPNTLQEHSGQPFVNAVAAVQAYVRDENLARAIVATSRGNIMGVLRYFRVSNARYDWSVGQGIEMSFDFQNYWVPRQGITPWRDVSRLSSRIRQEGRRTDRTGRSNQSTSTPETTPGTPDTTSTNPAAATVHNRLRDPLGSIETTSGSNQALSNFLRRQNRR